MHTNLNYVITPFAMYEFAVFLKRKNRNEVNIEYLKKAILDFESDLCTINS